MTMTKAVLSKPQEKMNDIFIEAMLEEFPLLQIEKMDHEGGFITIIKEHGFSFIVVILDHGSIHAMQRNDTGYDGLHTFPELDDFILYAHRYFNLHV